MLLLLTMVACLDLNTKDNEDNEYNEDNMDREDEDGEYGEDGEDEDEDEDGEDEDGGGGSDVEWDGTCDPVEDLPDNNALLAIGDSMFDWIDDCGDAPDLVGLILGEQVRNESVGGATMLGDIPGQYISGSWEWVIIDGGGNDMDCERTSDCREIIAEIVDTTHELLGEVLSDGAKVALVGYPNFRDDSEIAELWSNVGEEMMSSMEGVADAYDDVYFVDLRPVMDGADQPGLFDDDGLHPSASGAAVMATAIAGVIEANR